MKDNMRTIECEYFGQKYRLRTHEDSDLTEDTLKLINQLIEKHSEKNRLATPNQILILSLLDIASEYLKSKKRVQIYQEELTESFAELEKYFKS
jgi:cell division protein ZapA (FtsZ GTPase activity inhibitor)